MRNYHQPGLVIDHTPSSNIAAGTPVAIGSVVGVAKVDVLANTEGSFSVNGVYELPKASEALEQGAVCYLNGSGSITATATDNTRAGYVWAPADKSAGTVLVKLDG